MMIGMAANVTHSICMSSVSLRCLVNIMAAFKPVQHAAFTVSMPQAAALTEIQGEFISQLSLSIDLHCCFSNKAI